MAGIHLREAIWEDRRHMLDPSARRWSEELPKGSKVVCMLITIWPSLKFSTYQEENPADSRTQQQRVVRTNFD